MSEIMLSKQKMLKKLAYELKRIFCLKTVQTFIFGIFQ